MCGIAGIVLSEDRLPNGIDPEILVKRMIEKLRHRGPEAIGIKSYNKGKCWLAHSRLRVSDESSRADQPLETESGRWSVVFNGEVYNYEDLEIHLKATGWKAKTNSDTERLIEFIERAGIESFHSIDGMFAIGAYDQKSKNLLIARDRFGQKPLYYLNENGLFAFASEMSALLELSSWIKMEISIESISQYFTLRYIQAPDTAIKQIKKLEPGQYIIYGQKGYTIKDRYFTPNKNGTQCCNDINQAPGKLLREEPEEVIHTLLAKSIDKTVPDHAAMIVSGGVDSTLMASYTKESDKLKGKILRRKAYTMQLEHQNTEDSEWAKSLCTEWGWEHQVINMSDRQLINAYLKLVEKLDEPLGDRSLLPSWCLAQNIQPHSRVAIGGDGGDELFVGYGRYLKMAPYLKKLTERANWAEAYWTNALRVGEPEAIKAANQKILIEPLRELYGQLRILQSEYRHSPIEYLQMLDLITYLPGSVLSKADRSSMDWGLEIRSPMLNTRFALAALALKPEANLKDKRLKAVLKQLLEKQTGKYITNTKSGFGAAIRTGSELETYLQSRTKENYRKLNNEFSRTKTMEWINVYVTRTKDFDQNALFALSVMLDWICSTVEKYKGVKLT